MKKQPILSLTNISKSFHVGTVNENPVINSLDLAVYPGDFITIVGGNGAGKSTLLNVISGNLMPDSGDIQLGGQVLTHHSEQQRATKMARVFQDPTMGTAPRMTIAENLRIAALRGQKRGLHFGMNQAVRQQFKILVASLQLGLEDKLDTEVQYLSGGQRQAIALLMATIQTPEILLLDEHTAALDPQVAHTVMELTNERITSEGITALMITHNLSDAIQYGNRLIMLQRGKIVLDLSGQDKAALTSEELLMYFKQHVSRTDLSDSLLLS
ncbi:ATP-binding cassette domain-containing protein [Dolosigranulum savutiense]|uniref:ATP-binding cassette domain-containing protein n=1 Tax=Dolosigranulum savutiense TaxID=3110288 RepID=A0AB74U0Q7_9LACT